MASSCSLFDRAADAPTSLAAAGNRQRSRLVAGGRLAQQGDVLPDDALFKIPSVAALLLTGSQVNGRRS